nr:putative reverse transcriptase domain-containing protein [Tanacetum cinerariifolium]
CLSNEPLAISLDEIHIDDKVCFVEELVEIMDREVKQLKRSCIPIIKVRWNSRRGLLFTWEREDQFRKKTSPRVPSNLDNGNMALLQPLDFTIHNLHGFFNELELIIYVDLIQRNRK